MKRTRSGGRRAETPPSAGVWDAFPVADLSAVTGREPGLAGEFVWCDSAEPRENQPLELGWPAGEA